MARLNESTTSVESVEALKRRFVRQNRELARVNSMQSLRIRSLESEVSHLLAENVSLREQTIALGQEIERYEAAKLLHEGVYDIKSKLENKLIELNNLVTGLGALPRQFSKPYGGRIDCGAPRDLAQSNWDLRHSEANIEPGFATEQNWRLPVIPEDKDYTKDESGSHERDASIESTGDTAKPETVEDCITQTQLEQNDLRFKSPNEFTDYRALDGVSAFNDSLLPPTLETRKRRKYNTASTEKPLEMDCKQIQPDRSLEGTQNGSVATPPDDDFKFSRPSVLRKRERDDPCGDLAVERSHEVNNDSMGNEQLKRKALKPKNANLNLVPSYRLQAPTKGDQSQSPAIDDLGNDKGQTAKSTAANESICPRQSIPTKKDDLEHSENNRDESIHKSTTTEPGCAGKEPKHSPPLAAMPNEAPATESDPPSRPTRRQRAVVSYAEPNLRDKMRRSNNEFVAAVGNGQSRRASNSQVAKTDTCDRISGCASSRASSGSLDMNTAVHFSDGSATQQMISVSQRKRKISPPVDYNTAPGKHHSSDEITDASPVVISPSCGRHPENTSFTELQTDMEEYLHQSTFENIGDTSMELEDASKTAPHVRKQARRHSSNQRSFPRELPPLHSRVVSGKESPSTSSPSSLIRLSYSDDSMKDEKSAPSETQAGVSETPNNKSTAPLEIGTGQTKRKQRVSVRRRSMML